MNFGQFLTYKGTNLTTVKTYAKDGNLIFAEITEGADKGFYIFGGKAEGHMVTKEVFDAYKTSIETRIKELERLADMTVVKGEDGSELRMTVSEYVASVIASLKTELGLGTASKLDSTTTVRPAATATDDVLPTEKAVRTAIDTAITSLGTVLEFKGVLAAKPATDTYKHGDFIIVDGTEYVLVETTTTNEGGETVTTKSWEEIGDVKETEAVRTIGGLAGVVKIANGLVADESTNTVSIDLSGISYAPVFTENIDGVDTPVDYSKLFNEATGVTNVKEALDDLYKDHKVISASLVDQESRIATLEESLAGLDVVTVSGDDATYSKVEPTTDADVNVDYKVSNVLAEHSTGVEGEEGYVAPVSGLATDAYVAEAIRRALAWQEITGPAE